jgi:hypothetical protein
MIASGEQMGISLRENSFCRRACVTFVAFLAFAGLQL